ncbi:MAG TPA: TIGR03862 family flavoprotein [Xanthobacteraceae bacterium]
MTTGSDPSRPHIAVIGGGPAGLMAAEILSGGGARVTLYDRMPSPGRKFLLAGRGGLNLTHSEELEHLLDRYGAAKPRLRAAIEAFPPDALRAWCEGLGQETFVGSSGRVFPKAFKASPLLRTWLRGLDAAGVEFKPRHLWGGWDDDGALIFTAPQGRVTVHADAAVLALGGASWPRLGSDGGWVETASKAGIAVTPLAPANCGFTVDWSPLFRGRFEGEPLKRIALSVGTHTARGEAVITRTGLEGGGLYALSAPLRDGLAAAGEAMLRIDLRPDMSATALAARLGAPRGKQSLATFLRKTVALPPVALGLLHEAQIASGTRPAAMSADALAALIKTVPVRLTGMAPLASAISTAGGIAFEEIDARAMLTRRPGVFVAGEMLDWEAPTGGYLLQACFATGVAAAHGALAWLAARPAAPPHRCSRNPSSAT